MVHEKAVYTRVDVGILTNSEKRSTDTSECQNVEMLSSKQSFVHMKSDTPVSMHLSQCRTAKDSGPERNHRASHDRESCLFEMAVRMARYTLGSYFQDDTGCPWAPFKMP